MRKQKAWHDQDEFWATFAPKMFSETTWANAVPQVDQLLVLNGAQPGDAFLDLGCGPGRHSLELARRGFKVTGVDRTSLFLEQASRKAKEESLPVDFIQEDMRHFSRSEAFHHAISMFTSFGYFEDHAENIQVIQNVFNSLKENGTFLIELMGKEVLARVYRERDWSETDSILYLEERQVTRNWTWMSNRWIMINGAKRFEIHLDHWLYSAVELSAMLKQCGFLKVDAYGGLDGSPYDTSAKRLVVVGYK